MPPRRPRGSLTFIRFVVARIDADSGRRQGLFQAARVLRESSDLNGEDRNRLEALRDWFNLNLERPARLSISRRAHGKKQAIGWFRGTAARHIGKMRELQQLLEAHGMAVEVIKTRRPGYVVYEDDFQIAAYPFSDTPT
jgi:hypothetical protein